MYVLSQTKRIIAVRALCEGSSIRATSRIVGAHRDTVMRLGVAIGEGCHGLHDELFRNLASDVVEVDEAWSFVKKKQKRVLVTDPKEFGDQYSYIAMDADNKAILSYLVGKRNDATTLAFARDLRSRVTGSPQITSDGFHPYVKAISIAFGKNVDYAMLVKLYAAECAVESKRRYSAAEVVEVEKTVIFGDPDYGRISTSYVERQNLTLRMNTRRFTRLTNGFSKKLRNHSAAMDLYVGYYNLCRVHETLGMTPAMAIGITDHAWPVEELMEQAANYPMKNAPLNLGTQTYVDIECEAGHCAPIAERTKKQMRKSLKARSRRKS